MNNQASGWTAPWEANFRDHMKRLREAKGMTQSELARQLKQRGLPYHQQTVQRVESGERPIRLDEAFQIASVLESRVDLMIASPNALGGDLIFAVSRLRRETEEALAYLDTAFDEWMDAYSDLANAFNELLDAVGNEPTPEVRWGAAWLIKAKWVLDSYNDVRTYGNGLVATRPDWRDIPAPVVSSVPDWLHDESADIWQMVEEADRPTMLADGDPIELNDYLQRSNDGEHQEEA
jgi:transcriptional regulator with XRE-family HTH domain